MTTLKIPIKHKTKGINFMEIDEEDFDKIKDLNLTLNHTSNKNTYYAKSIVYEVEKILDDSEPYYGKSRKKCFKYIKKINIHRLIMGLDDYKNDKRIINHIDGNGLNNKKENLEICDTIHNSQSINRKHQTTKGYYFENDPKRKGKWKVNIKIYGVTKSKRFLTEQECIDYINSLDR
tara:strand:- start:636 stop:1166 length:531 start_codon:yes stop_codon:yes gene_type:complete